MVSTQLGAAINHNTTEGERHECYPEGTREQATAPPAPTQDDREDEDEPPVPLVEVKLSQSRDADCTSAKRKSAQKSFCAS